MKVDKKVKKGFLEFGILVLVFLLASGMLYTSILHSRARHNIDLAYNYEKLVNDVNEITTHLGANSSVEMIPYPSNVGDTGADGVTRPLRDYYIAGQVQLENSFTTMFFLCLFAGYVIGRAMK